LNVKLEKIFLSLEEKSKLLVLIISIYTHREKEKKYNSGGHDRSRVSFCGRRGERKPSPKKKHNKKAFSYKF
jgi:hypothetical protein